MEATDANVSMPIAGGGDPDWAQLNDLPRPFDVISEELAALGALSLDDFLSGSTSTATDFDISFHLQSIVSSSEKGTCSTTEAAEESQGAGYVAPAKYYRSAVPLLNQTSQRIFGSTDAIKFEFLEEDPKNKQCVLSIIRPNGATRSYQSGPGFSRRGDAKAQAAKIAIEMGAIEFIASGDVNTLKAKKGHLLNPIDVDIDRMELDEIAAAAMQKFAEEELPVKQIEQCCKEWRLGQVKPHWVSFNDSKNKKQHGSALRIALNAHVFRAYSVDPIYNSAKEAKIACAKVALEEGVIEFIQFGNGQIQPPPKVEQVEQDEMANDRKDILLKPLTLQEFYDSLPQPFPESVGEMTASEINAPGWLNTTMQSARGGQLHSNFTPIVDSARHLHGCILRLERPGETKTYLMDAQFPKRSDAKSAVCLLAMSQGVGDYIRKLKETAENKLPADKRKLANEKILQVLATDCSKVRNGNRPIFEFTSGRDAFGCILKADISPLASEPNIQEYRVQVEYRTKADAKAAVACLAAEQGLIDLLRFKGAMPPPDYIPFWEAQVNGTGDNYVGKRKEPERDLDGEGRDRKKRRKGNKDSGFEPGEVPDVKVKQDFEHPLPNKPVTVSSPIASSSSPKPIRKKPHTTGSSCLGPTNASTSAMRTVVQDQLGNRSGGPDHHHSYAMYPSPQSPSFPSFVHPPHVVYGPGPAYQSGPAPMFTSSDPYQGAYVSYPPPIQGHHPSPYQPVAPHPYPTYFAVPSSSSHPSSVAPTHMPYAPYPYHQYPQPYSHGHYPVNYGPHPPVMYHTGPTIVPASTYPPMAAAVPPPYPIFTPPPPLESTRSPPQPSHHRPSDEITNNGSWSSTSDSRTNESYNRQTGNNTRNGTEHPSENDDQQKNDQCMTAKVPQNSREPPPHDHDDAVRMPNEIEIEEVPLTIQATKTNLALLYAHCEKEGVQRPSFFYELVEEAGGSKKYKVWAEKESQRLELQTLFLTIEEGRERLAKQVLLWELRSKAKKPKC